MDRNTNEDRERNRGDYKGANRHNDGHDRERERERYRHYDRERERDTHRDNTYRPNRHYDRESERERYRDTETNRHHDRERERYTHRDKRDRDYTDTERNRDEQKRARKVDNKNIVIVLWDGVIRDTAEQVFLFQKQNAPGRPYSTMEELSQATIDGRCYFWRDQRFLDDLDRYLEDEEAIFFDDVEESLKAIKADPRKYEIHVAGDMSKYRWEKEKKKWGERFQFDEEHIGTDFPRVETTGEVFFVTASSRHCALAHERFRDLTRFKVISVTRFLEPAIELEHHHNVVCNSFKEVASYITTDVPQTEFSYLFSGYYGCERLQLHKHLRGWKLIPGRQRQQPYIDYIRLEHTKNRTRDKSLNYVECTLKNVLEGDALQSVTNKRALYYTMKELFPEDYSTFMPQSWCLDDKMSVAEDEVLIVKPVGDRACAGNGISVVFNTQQLEDAKRKVLKQWKEGIISRYIRKPLLFKGLKFHFRCYILVSSWGTYIPYPRADILTASKPYVDDSYLDTEIHDSHGKSTLKDCFFPEDIDDPDLVVGETASGEKITKRQKIQQVLDLVMDKIIFAIKQKCALNPYSESQNGYELLAPDVMLDEDYNPFLLEVNSRVGFGAVKGVNEYYHDWERGFLDWEYENTLKLFETKGKNKKWTLDSDQK